MARPTDYKPEYATQAAKLAILGATDSELADFFEVEPRTIYRWKNAHEEFCQALKVGKDIADDRVERSLYHNANGYDYTEQQAIKVKISRDEEEIQIVEVRRHRPADTTACIFWLKNRRKEEWRDKQEVEHSGEVKSQIHVIKLPDNGRGPSSS